MDYGRTRLALLLGLSLTTACVIAISDDDDSGGTTGTPDPTTGNVMPGTDESTTGEVGESSGSSGMADSSTGGDSTSSEGGDSSTGKPETACQPEGNFGACTAGTDCPTIQGQLGLQACFETSPGFNSCAAPCETAGECGNSEDFGGAIARCLDTGTFSQCFLTCTTSDDCPCDLECQPLEMNDNISVCTSPA